MDQFGVLLEGAGFRSQRSAPMASLKPKPKTNSSFNDGFPQSLLNDTSVDGLDGIFHPKHNGSNNIVNNGIDIFGGGSGDVFDLESVLNSNKKYDQMSPTPSVAADDLIPGLWDTNVSGSTGIQPEAYPSHTSSSAASTSTFSEAHDPFSIFDTPTFGGNSNGTPLESSLADLENFARAKVPGAATDKPNVAKLTGIRISLNKKDGKATSNSFASKVHKPEENQREKDKHKVENKKNEAFVHDNIPDNLFGMDNDSNRVDLHKTQTKDPIYEALFSKKSEPKLQKAASQPSYSIKKPSPVNVMNEGFDSLFSDAPSSAFQELKGESEERRRARLNQHMRTQERMAKALAEKNERDYQTQYEQEEKHRIAEGLDYDIKRWSAGKEGNLLALLSSLQDVLWDGCGWQPVSLTDLIAPASVKKVYQKANLCLHPDKVQQKGSTLQQKYIAEKVFDLLKEAWNKHNSQGSQPTFNMHF